MRPIQPEGVVEYPGKQRPRWTADRTQLTRSLACFANLVAISVTRRLPACAGTSAEFCHYRRNSTRAARGRSVRMVPHEKGDAISTPLRCRGGRAPRPRPLRTLVPAPERVQLERSLQEGSCCAAVATPRAPASRRQVLHRSYGEGGVGVSHWALCGRRIRAEASQQLNEPLSEPLLARLSLSGDATKLEAARVAHLLEYVARVVECVGGRVFAAEGASHVGDGEPAPCEPGAAGDDVPVLRSFGQ